jgi:tetratricopeptide (TPR) repeat protein
MRSIARIMAEFIGGGNRITTVAARRAQFRLSPDILPGLMKPPSAIQTIAASGSGPVIGIVRAYRHGSLSLLVVLVWFGFVVVLATLVGRQVRAAYHYRAAQEALAHYELAVAQDHLAECLHTWNGRADLHFLAARTARRLGAFDCANEHLNESLRLGSDSDEIYLERMLLRAQGGQPAPLADWLLGLVHEGHPDSVFILEALAQGYRSSHQLPPTRACLQLWLERRPDDAEALLISGEMHEFLRERDEALDDYRRAVASAPTREDARLRLAASLSRAGRTAEAVAHYEWLHARQPANPDVLVGLARGCQDLDELPRAQQLLDEFLVGQPQSVATLIERGRAALRGGEAAAAEGWLRRALDLEPDSPEANYVLQLCREIQGQESADLTHARKPSP